MVTAEVVQHNARFNDDMTVRWPTLPVRVFLNGIAGADEVTAWTEATGGAVTFMFVGGPGEAGARFAFGAGPDVCGLAEVEYTSRGTITDVGIQIARDFRGPFCMRTVTHEMGHAIGFLDHTTNGGLMDADGGDGRFTPEVVRTIRSLYGLPPGTAVVPAERRLGSGGAEIRRRITIVDPARR